MVPRPCLDWVSSLFSGSCSGSVSSSSRSEVGGVALPRPAGPRREAPSGSRAGSYVVVYVGFGVAIPVRHTDGNHANATSAWGGQTDPRRPRADCCSASTAGFATRWPPPTRSARSARTWTASAAGDARLNTIINGCLQNPPPGSPEACLGYGTMPALIIEPEDAQEGRGVRRQGRRQGIARCFAEPGRRRFAPHPARRIREALRSSCRARTAEFPQRRPSRKATGSGGPKQLGLIAYVRVAPLFRREPVS